MPKELRKDIGRKEFKAIRLNANLTQVECAEYLGLGLKQISRMENGSTPIKPAISMLMDRLS